MSTITTSNRKTARPAYARRRESLLPKRWYVHILLWITIFIVGFPLLYAIVVSTQSNAETLSFQATFGSHTRANLETVIVDRNLLRFMWNSTLLAIFVTIGKTILSLLAGLAFVYFRFPGKWLVFGFILITLLMPTEMLIIALFRLVSELEWGNTFWAISVPFLASATGSFLFRQHFANLPSELSEAAQIDGANPLQFLIRVLIPISWNTIGALAVIQFVYMWNQYLWPSLIIKDERIQVVQVGLGALRNAEGSLTYGPMMMGAVIATIPPVVVFILLQRQFMRGFAISRDK
ncbi:MAG: carbohydrate ABC transporter permease [Anaerolineae bacterium]|nr:carbohydrate ABC transporter permease [Anaerolineae bacterium]